MPPTIAAPVPGGNARINPDRRSRYQVQSVAAGSTTYKISSIHNSPFQHDSARVARPLPRSFEHLSEEATVDDQRADDPFPLVVGTGGGEDIGDFRREAIEPPAIRFRLT